MSIVESARFMEAVERGLVYRFAAAPYLVHIVRRGHSGE